MRGDGLLQNWKRNRSQLLFALTALLELGLGLGEEDVGFHCT
jgi:hypothetical protein